MLHKVFLQKTELQKYMVNQLAMYENPVTTLFRNVIHKNTYIRVIGLDYLLACDIYWSVFPEPTVHDMFWMSEWQGGFWILNLEGCGRKQSWANWKVVINYWPGEPEENRRSKLWLMTSSPKFCLRCCTVQSRYVIHWAVMFGTVSKPFNTGIKCLV